MSSPLSKKLAPYAYKCIGYTVGSLAVVAPAVGIACILAPKFEEPPSVMEALDRSIEDNFESIAANIARMVHSVKELVIAVAELKKNKAVVLGEIVMKTLNYTPLVGEEAKKTVKYSLYVCGLLALGASSYYGCKWWKKPNNGKPGIEDNGIEDN